VDRAALDAALKHAIDCGGWCPAGRLDEKGRIPDRYPLKELAQGGFVERTLQNVQDSDGTVIIFCGQLRGGTKQTARFCENEKRPYQTINATKASIDDAAQLISNFVRKNKIQILNVAGPRESEWPQGYEYAARALEGFF
jgi:Circularly permutated YpsA SLOG family